MMRRIVILGPTGSGKTTFGKRLSALTGIPATDLDDIFWLPDWKQRTTEEFYRLAEGATQGESWIITGNYSKIRGAIWPKADTFIWIDYPFLLVLWQLLRRSVMRVVDKRPVCNGNFETWRGLFLSKNSLILWLFQSYWRRGREYAEIFEAGRNAPDVAYIRLRSRKETEAFLEGQSTVK